MATYRAYRTDQRRHIRTAQWLEAPDDQAAKTQAQQLCDEQTPIVEVWQAARLVDEIDCRDED